MEANFFTELGMSNPYDESGQLTAEAAKAIETVGTVISAVVHAGYQLGVSEADLIAEIREDAMGGDDYKTNMLRTMLMHEQSPAEEHYGANLSHWHGDTKPLTIDAGGLNALLRYYQTHQTNMG